MILVITGTHQQPFNRLLQAVDALATSEERIYQTGYSTYVPAHGQVRAFLPPDEMKQLMQQARVIVCHAGTGTVMSALDCGKCPVVAPRLERFGEHVDDHQLQLVAGLEGFVIPFMPDDNLAGKIAEAENRSSRRAAAPAEALTDHLHQAIRGSALKRSSV